MIAGIVAPIPSDGRVTNIAQTLDPETVGLAAGALVLALVIVAFVGALLLVNSVLPPKYPHGDCRHD
jgi:hypothetical protein